MNEVWGTYCRCFVVGCCCCVLSTIPSFPFCLVASQDSLPRTSLLRKLRKSGTPTSVTLQPRSGQGPLRYAGQAVPGVRQGLGSQGGRQHCLCRPPPVHRPLQEPHPNRNIPSFVLDLDKAPKDRWTEICSVPEVTSVVSRGYGTAWRVL